MIHDRIQSIYGVNTAIIRREYGRSRLGYVRLRSTINYHQVGTASATDKATATITAADHNDDDLWFGMDITQWKPLTIDDEVRMKL